MKIKIISAFLVALMLVSCNTVVEIPSYIPNSKDTIGYVTETDYPTDGGETTAKPSPVPTDTSDNIVTEVPDTNDDINKDTLEPTEDPKPTVVPPETDDSDEGKVPEGPMVSGDYFDDAAFVGDSVSLRLRMHALANKDALGKANFFTVGSFSAYDALQPVTDTSIHPSYQGKKMTVEDCISACGAKKVYIMLGMNDISDYRGGADVAVSRYTQLVKRILAKNPGVIIYVQSMTPTLAVSSVHSKGITNERIKEYNRKLQKACAENGWNFVDVASVMYDSTGKALKSEYCSDPEDMALHLTDAAAKEWVKYLKTHTVR